MGYTQEPFGGINHGAANGCQKQYAAGCYPKNRVLEQDGKHPHLPVTHSNSMRSL